MIFNKIEDGYEAITSSGKKVAYIKKQYIGTHGHWVGYKHYFFCDAINDFVWAGVRHMMVDGKWVEAESVFPFPVPAVFNNIKDFKSFYLGGC